MAHWIEFISDVDYKHKSRAVTAYKAGMIVYVPNHIVESEQTKGNFKMTDKFTGSPADKPGDGRSVFDGNASDSVTETAKPDPDARDRPDLSKISDGAERVYLEDAKADTIDPSKVEKVGR